MLKEIVKIGPVTLFSYGLMLMVALIVAMAFGRKRAPKFGLKPDHVYDAALWAMIPGILGARIVYIAQEWKYYSQHPEKLYSLQFEGLTSFGGVVFGLIGLWFYSKRAKISPLALLDTLGATFLIAHSFGRVGCLLNGCCYGRPCVGWYCIPVSADKAILFMPAQLFDGLFNLIGLAILIVLERRKILRFGQSFGLAMVFHGLARYLYEFWRAGTVAEVAQGVASSTLIAGTKITEAQVAALILAALGLLVFFMNRKKPLVDGTTNSPVHMEPVAT